MGSKSILENEIAKFSQMGFYEVDPKFLFPQSIHDKRAIKFFTTIIARDNYVEDILTNRLKLPLKEVVGKYNESNNKSAKENMQDLRSIIRKWRGEGKVVKLINKPDIVNPMSVIIQKKIDGMVKIRPVIDCSRYINSKFCFGTVKLDDLKVVESLIMRGDFVCSIDFSSMYHQIWLHDDTAEILNFSIVNENNEAEYYRFKVMQFGISPAVFVVTKLLVPVRNYFRALNIRYNLFIDDSIICCKCPELATQQIEFVMLVFKLLGWKINLQKSSLVPSQKVIYLGFRIDSVLLKYFYPEKKLIEVKELISEILKLARNAQEIKVKFVAKLLGKLCSMSKSHGMITSIFSRKCQHIVGKSVYYRGWDTSCLLDSHAQIELTFLFENLEKFNGRKIFKTKKSIKIFSKEYFSEEFLEDRDYDDPNIFISDASASKSFIYNSNETFDLVEDFMFTEQERSYASGHRELLSIVKTLEKHKSYFKNISGVVYWLTDSRNVYSFLRKGSRKLQIQKDIVKIKLFEADYDVLVVPIWAPRSDTCIEYADLGSKLHLSSDEWGIDEKTFKFIQTFFQLEFTVDGFATSVNKKCGKYFSKIPQLHTSGVNFFAQKLVSKEVYWLCPPIKDVKDVIEYVEKFENITAVVFLPVWAGALYWFSIKNDCKFKWFVRNYLLVSPKFENFSIGKNLFEGYKKFKNMAILIDTSKISKSDLKFPENIFNL